MRYESMIIVDPVKGKSETDRVAKDLEGLVSKCGGKEIDIEKYGERKLAYNVKKFKRGYYYLLHFDMDGEKVPQYRRELKLNEEVLRYMIFKDKDADLERRDLSKPVYFNVDLFGHGPCFEKGHFSEKPGSFREESKPPSDDSATDAPLASDDQDPGPPEES